MTYASVLPPGSTPLEKALEQVTAFLLDLPVDMRKLWSPMECPAAHLPWLAWGLSVDIWDADWPEAVKRAAVADAIGFHRRKGTAASLRTVLDRFDPLIRIVEWFEDRDTLDPYMFRLELPLSVDSPVIYDEALVAQILRDIAAVKPVRARMVAVHKLRADAEAWLTSGALAGGISRMDAAADLHSATDPVWGTYLQTANGEPIISALGAFLEV
ncbi:phage tail protein I [Sphingobium abikonense]|uniref:phage tail protein I n=1 Tax=Sphingobium abikonense TaxID=86193 RepID=UPI000786F94D|nr:phage tail protein I [Sphingobium abikonense]